MESVPKTFVLSRIAKTMVKTRRKGSTTSKTPILSRKAKLSLKADAI